MGLHTSTVLNLGASSALLGNNLNLLSTPRFGAQVLGFARWFSRFSPGKTSPSQRSAERIPREWLPYSGKDFCLHSELKVHHCPGGGDFFDEIDDGLVIGVVTVGVEILF